jgi:hypothetical protein
MTTYWLGAGIAEDPAGGPVKVRLIREIPQQQASSPTPVSPVTQANPAAPFKRVKRSWDEVLAKFGVPDNKPTAEKDSDDN